MERKTEEYTDITAWVREELLRHAEEEYGEFHKSLVPGLKSMRGVRVPNIRKIAKKAAKMDYHTYAKEADLSVYEELMIRGMMIGYACLTMEEQKTELRKFVPHINNWAVCDCCCATYKFMKKNQEDWFSFLEEYVCSHSEYQVRFAVVCMLDFFICEAFLERVLDLLSQIRHEGYYVKMAVAWAVSICYIKFPKETERLFTENLLDDFTHNKAIQKIRESYRVENADKEWLNTLKRK